MPDPVLIGQAAVAAALVALAVVLSALSRPALAAAGGAVGVGLGVLVGAWVLGLAPCVPPREDLDRLLLVLVPAAIAAEAVAAFAGRVGWLLRLAVAAAAAPVLLHGSSYLTDLSGPGSRAWSPEETWLILGGLAVALAAAWGLLTRAGTDAGRRTAVCPLIVASAGAAVVVMLSGYASGGQLGFPLAAALAGAGAVSLLRRGRPVPIGAIGVGVVGLFALLVVGRFFAALTTTNAVLLFSAPVLCGASQVLLARRAGPRLRGAIGVILTVVPVATALYLAQQKFVADSVRTTPAATEPSLQDYLDYGGSGTGR